MALAGSSTSRSVRSIHFQDKAQGTFGRHPFLTSDSPRQMLATPCGKLLVERLFLSRQFWLLCFLKSAYIPIYMISVTKVGKNPHFAPHFPTFFQF
jgi:hypothetical protein